jgi:GR25 family glycosyltransferase involved in LPS biosynthesis
MSKEIFYYVIHNSDPVRKNNMLKLIEENNFKNVTWLEYPNGNEITDEHKNTLVKRDVKMTLGAISCTYKHYLAIKDIVEKGHELAVIMEDNIGGFYKNQSKEIDRWLSELPEDWNIVFDGWPDMHYYESKTTPDRVVYHKNNQVSPFCAGSTKSAMFYMLNLSTAKKLLTEFIPFDEVPDKIMNEMFRKWNMKSFWVEPCGVFYEKDHRSTTATDWKWTRQL